MGHWLRPRPNIEDWESESCIQSWNFRESPDTKDLKSGERPQSSLAVKVPNLEFSHGENSWSFTVPWSWGAKNNLEHGMLGRQNLPETNIKLAPEHGMLGILNSFPFGGEKAYVQEGLLWLLVSGMACFPYGYLRFVRGYYSVEWERKLWW